MRFFVFCFLSCFLCNCLYSDTIDSFKDEIPIFFNESQDLVPIYKEDNSYIAAYRFSLAINSLYRMEHLLERLEEEGDLGNPLIDLFRSEINFCKHKLGHSFNDTPSP